MPDTRPHVRVPKIVFDALERGEISERQSSILCAMYHWADHRTGCIDSFSAERVCRFLRINVTDANLRALRRQILGLKRMGWFHDDYRHLSGSKRTYHAWLHNYYRENDDVRDNDRDFVREDSILNPCEISPYADARRDSP
jgi:hypothetical protein